MVTNIIYYLERAVKKYPDKSAIADENIEFTYKEYQNFSKKVASFLIEKGIICKKPVAVLIDRNVYSVVAFIGCAYSGNFYVPIDCTMPIERVELILNSLKPSIIIDARNSEKNFPGAIKIRDILLKTYNEEKLESIKKKIIDTDPLYAIFTSGSTGVPKGVLVSHKSVIDLVENFSKEFQFDEKLVFGNQAPFDFDVSVKDIYNSLLNCAKLEIIPKRLFMMPVKLIEYIKDRNINTLIWAVSALRIVADFNTFTKTNISSLRYIMFSGECMPVKALNYWIENVPEARYVNLYGPTEITCNCTYYEVKGKQKVDKALPVGKAFPNTRILLLNEKCQLIQTEKIVGEICIEGSSLALGYWNNQDKTKEVFIQEPGNSVYPNRVYCTGDLGYYDENDNLVFVSRKDFQIKHMGHRIELGEVEVALNSISFIEVSCCLYDEKKEKIICIYQSAEEKTKDIVQELGKKLPKYMWPNIYLRMDKLPLNKNGKIDRKSLKEQVTDEYV